MIFTDYNPALELYVLPKMKSPFCIMALLLSLISVGCNSEKQHTTEAKTAESNPTPAVMQTIAREVNRYEFVESELVKYPEDEKKLNHNYMGSLDGFDYISVRGREYRIPSDQLKLKNSFVLTKDASKWVHLRIHFSHIKYNLD